MTPGSLTRGAAKATQMAWEGQREPYRPYANDPESMVQLFAPYMPGVGPDWKPREFAPLREGQKPHLVWAGFQAAHRRYHRCPDSCKLARQLYDLGTRWRIPWAGAARLAERTVTHAPEDDEEREAISGQLEALLASGVLREVTGTEADDASSMDVFLVRKSAYKPAEGTAPGAAGPRAAAQAAADRLVGRLAAAGTRGDVTLSRALDKGAEAGKLRLVYNAAPANPLLAPLPFRVPGADTFTGTLNAGDWMTVTDDTSALWSLYRTKTTGATWAYAGAEPTGTLKGAWWRSRSECSYGKGRRLGGSSRRLCAAP